MHGLLRWFYFHDLQQIQQTQSKRSRKKSVETSTLSGTRSSSCLFQEEYIVLSVGIKSIFSWVREALDYTTLRGFDKYNYLRFPINERFFFCVLYLILRSLTKRLNRVCLSRWTYILLLTNGEKIDSTFSASKEKTLWYSLFCQLWEIDEQHIFFDWISYRNSASEWDRRDHIQSRSQISISSWTPNLW